MNRVVARLRHFFYPPHSLHRPVRVSSPKLLMSSAASSSTQHPKVRVALCQMLVGADKYLNLQNAHEAVSKAKNANAQLVLLPEMFNCPYSNDSFGPFAEEIPWDDGKLLTPIDPQRHPTTYALTHMAKDAAVYLVGGSFPERQNDTLFNTCLVLDPQGNIVAKHRKVHLFDISVPGGITFKESQTLTAGNSFTVVPTPFGKIGVGICYDIRFAEYAQILAQQGCFLLCYPGAFNMTTGPLHWELLQRARALDNQLFVVTCSPARNPESAYQAWGHSTVVDPWGVVVATTEHHPTLVVTDLDLKRMDDIRQNIPIISQKRYDLYSKPSPVAPNC